ncbi:MAG: DUF4397 domain-containing protein [Sphingobacteriia bacterium]|nr:DUF4397 domain-containing protein [Sphingobacteriia bacterium]
MKKITSVKNAVLLAVLIIIFGSCSKDSPIPQLVSLNVVNASINVAAAQVNYFGAPLTFATYTGNLVNYGANLVYSVNAGSTNISINAQADSTKSIYSGNLTANAGDVYTLYLSGQSTAVDTVLRKESIPYHPFSDSSFGVRFINLSYNSNPVNVTLSATATVNEFSGIGYKTITAFKNYTALLSTAGYTFQVRDAGNNIIATYAFTSTTMPRFFNCTLALIGQIGATGSNAPKVIRVNNY